MIPRALRASNKTHPHSTSQYGDSFNRIVRYIAGRAGCAIDRNDGGMLVRGEPMWIYFLPVYTNAHESKYFENSGILPSVTFPALILIINATWIFTFSSLAKLLLMRAASSPSCQMVIVSRAKLVCLNLFIHECILEVA